jgi:hypothetical protein
MATTELALRTDQTENNSGFIFDVALSTAIAANGSLEAQAPVPQGPLSPDVLDKMNRYWRAANYLCIGQIYLFENPLLRDPLKKEQIKPSGADANTREFTRISSILSLSSASKTSLPAATEPETSPASIVLPFPGF